MIVDPETDAMEEWARHPLARTFLTWYRVTVFGQNLVTQILTTTTKETP